jgi:hypothetical protein
MKPVHDIGCAKATCHGEYHGDDHKQDARTVDTQQIGLKEFCEDCEDGRKDEQYQCVAPDKQTESPSPATQITETKQTQTHHQIDHHSAGNGVAVQIYRVQCDQHNGNDRQNPLCGIQLILFIANLI